MKPAASVAFLLLLLILLASSLYLLYLNFPGELVEYNLVGKKSNIENIESSRSEQFYQNMRFPDKKITYRIENACDSKKRSEVREAFAILSESTVLEFLPSNQGQIQILCSEIPPEAENDDYFVAGEGGPTEVINTSLYAVIFSGKISFFRDEKCDNPNIALHEILHVLGFDHDNNPNSVLYPTLDCDQEVDSQVINDINSLYSIKSLPDLEIENIEGSKSSRSRLNFEVVVINQGLVDAGDVFLSVYYNDKLLKFEGGREFLEFGDIEVGTRKILTITNAKIPVFETAKAHISSESSEKLRFIIDEKNEIEEIFESNNEIELALKS